MLDDDKVVHPFKPGVLYRHPPVIRILKYRGSDRINRTIAGNNTQFEIRRAQSQRYAIFALSQLTSRRTV